jgi:hypothetical protein
MLRFLVPWRATGPGDVTLLMSPGRHLAKLITSDGIVDYDRSKHFEVDARRLEGVDDLHQLLQELAGRTDTCLIRGVLEREQMGQAMVLRRYRPGPDCPTPPFRPCARQWLMTDCEGMPIPPGVDPADPVMAGGAARRALPAPFRTARAVAQLSSKAGLLPEIRVHLWFWLDRAITDAEAKRWLKSAPVDASIYQPVAIHYTASPRFMPEVDDPVYERIAVLPGRDEVEVPPLPEPAKAGTLASPLAAPRPGAGQAGAEAYAMACLRSLALAPEGQRHRTCVAISCRLLALAKAGQLDPATVAGRIKGVMLGRGFDGRGGRDLSEIDSILAWAWQTVEPEELPYVR